MKPLINLVLVLLFNSTYCISDEVEKNKTTIWEIKAPLEMISFGACVAERNFYVHGGHLGAPHTYSEENISLLAGAPSIYHIVVAYSHRCKH